MIAMNEKMFQEAVLEGEKPVLVEFWAPWCVYCRRIAPALKKVAQEQREKILVGQVHIDENPALAEREMIEVVPTLVLYHRGQALGSIVAPDSKARIDEFLEEYLGN